MGSRDDGIHISIRGLWVCVCVDMCKMSGELTVANLDEASPC